MRVYLGERTFVKQQSLAGIVSGTNMTSIGSSLSIKSMLSILALAVLAVSIEARTMCPCHVASELLKNGIRQDELNKWVCIVMGESSGNTSAVNNFNTDGSKDFGLFQINSRYWCGEKVPAGECNMLCKDLLDDNISDDVKCARKIERIHGLDAWVVWTQKCKNGGLSRWNINSC